MTRATPHAIRIPENVHEPAPMASSLLTQAKGSRGEAEAFAWERMQQAVHQGNKPHADFWSQVFVHIVDHTEVPAVADAPVAWRFDANGKVITVV
jgi:hypothetical protein